MLKRMSLAVVVLLMWATSSVAAGWTAGDKVQVYVSGTWFDAVITGPGAYEGYYGVRFTADGSTSSAKEDAIRAIEQPQPVATGLVAGDYACVGFGSGEFRWYLRVTAEGTYQQLTPDLPAGNFGAVPDQQAIVFIDGPYFDNGWFGRISAGADGRPAITLRSLASEKQGPRVDEFANIYCSLKG